MSSVGRPFRLELHGFCLSTLHMGVAKAPLCNKTKAGDIMGFYKYLGSFKTNAAARDRKQDHFYDFITELHAVKEMGKLGPYWSISFKRGIAIPEEVIQDTVIPTMKQVYEFVVSSDEYFKRKIGAKAAVVPEVDPVIETEADEGDHPADDIPF